MNSSGPLIKTCQHLTSGSNTFPSQKKDIVNVCLAYPIIIIKIFVSKVVGIYRIYEVELIYDIESANVYYMLFLNLEGKVNSLTTYSLCQNELSTFMK